MMVFSRVDKTGLILSDIQGRPIACVFLRKEGCKQSKLYVYARKEIKIDRSENWCNLNFNYPIKGVELLSNGQFEKLVSRIIDEINR